MSYQASTLRTVEGTTGYTQTSSRVVSSNVSAIRGSISENIIESRLSYESNAGDQILISGSSDISHLRNMKNVLLSLQSSWLDQGNRFVLQGNEKEQFNKRLLLLESEIEGLMKRKINATTAQSNGRVLDYDVLMNEKENQIVELSKKIQNLEQKLRKSSKRQTELQEEIIRLTSVIKSVNNVNVTKVDLQRLCNGVLEYESLSQKYNNLRGQLLSFGSLFRTQVQKFRTQGIRFQNQAILDQLLMRENIQTITANGTVSLVETRDKVIEVPTQDARTKHLIHMLAVQMKKYFDKYPKLRDQCDARLYEFFQQELIDVIQADELDRVVEIVKFVPEVVKVENVYAYSSSKSRKVQYHLRVLIKALLEELEKLRKRTGVTLEIDEGVIGMINQEIMDVVNVDDILKVFRVVPKIVEVEKIVEKIVDRIVEVPQIVTVQKIIEKIVQVQKIVEIQKRVPVPIEVPIIVNTCQEKIVQVQKIIQKAVQIPIVQDRIVEVIREVPKMHTVDRVVEKIVEVDRPVTVREVVNHVQTEIKQVVIYKQKIVTVEKIVEKIVQVPIYVEKIVQKIVRVAEIVEVQKIVQKIVKEIDVVTAKEVQNHIQVKNVIVDRIVERPVVIIQRQERIVEVPQIVEKVVSITNTVDRPFAVEVIIQKIVPVDRIIEVEKIITKIVEVYKEVPKQVERIVQVPVIHERVIKVQEFIEKPVIQIIQRQVPVIVYIRDPLIVREPKVVQIERIVNHYIEVPKPIKYIQEKIVEVLRHVDRIKQIKVPVQKIIEKMVQVPKVVQVEKIIEKIVVVPRVVEKIVEVIQIVERVVPKIIIEERIKEVQKIVQVPVVQTRVQEVVVQKNVYIQVDRVVQKVVDKLVQLKTVEQRIVPHETIVQRVIEVIREVPREIPVEKIVYNQIQVPKVVQVEKQIIVPVEISVPVDRVVEKLVPMIETIEKIVQVPTVLQKIVVQNVIQPQTVDIVRTEQKVVIDTKVKEVIKEVPYIRTQINQVERIVEKIIPVHDVVTEIVTAKQIVQKVVDRSVIVPKIYEVERIQEKLIEVPRIVQVERIVPQLINVNKYIQKIVQKIVEVPVIMERIKQVTKENEKLVELRNEYETVKEVERVVQKAVIFEKFKEAVRDINHIEKVLQIVDRIVNIPVSIIAHEQKLVEVPYILEKIVEKIVVMPQIVQVLKYVHEVIEEETLGVAIGVDVHTHEQKYKLLVKDIKLQLDGLLNEIRKLKTGNPTLRVQIELIETFLAQLDQFILFPRIVEVPKIVEKIVEVQKKHIVALPKDDRSLKMQLSLSLLVEKLILELKRIRRDNPSVKLDLEDDVRLLFFTELDGPGKSVDAEFSTKLRSFSQSINRKFESLGPWSADHQLMLSSFLQERFLMANLVKSANLEIEKSKTSNIRVAESLRKYESDVQIYKGCLNKLRSSLSSKFGIEVQSIITTIFADIERLNSGQLEVVRDLGDLKVTDLRIQSLLREKDAEIYRLRDEISGLTKLKSSINNEAAHQRTIQILNEQNSKLKTQINALRVDRGSSQLITSYKQQIQSLNQRIHELQQQKSDLNAQLINLKNQYEVRLSVQNYNSTIDIKRSAVTDIRGSETSRSDFRSNNLTSPVQKYNLNNAVGSPKDQAIGIKMVDSKIQAAGSVFKSPTYGLTDSQHSSGSASKEQSSNYRLNIGNVSSTYQTPTNSISGGSSVIGDSSSLSGSGVHYGKPGLISSNIYEVGSNSGNYQVYGTSGRISVPTYQATSNVYQSGSNSGVNQAGTSSGIYQSGSGVYQAGSSSGVNQGGVSGTYQSGTTYQGGSYQPYQSGYTSYQSSTVKGAPGSTTSQIQGSATQYSSTYRYEKK